MKILITGVSGFIGFSLAQKLLKENFYVYGIDNFDDYYSVPFKKKRFFLLKQNKKFKFFNIDFVNKKKLANVFRKHKFDFVFHLGAQAGVRYSLINPVKYYDTNIIGFSNILKEVAKNKVKNLFYASSSSVYGEAVKFPSSENDKINPKNIYAMSKQINEQMAEDISKNFKINIVGLRFFTVYGQWGRPDMFIMKLIKSIINQKTFLLHNRGNHFRDFTYIDDVVEIVFLLMKKRNIGHNIYNVCSNRPLKLFKIVKLITNYFEKLPIIKQVGFQEADVFKTHGNNKKIIDYVKFKNFTPIEVGIKKTIDWYKKNKISEY